MDLVTWKNPGVIGHIIQHELKIKGLSLDKTFSKGVPDIRAKYQAQNKSEIL